MIMMIIIIIVKNLLGSRQLLGSGQMRHEAEQRRGRLRQDQVHDQ